MRTHYWRNHFSKSNDEVNTLLQIISVERYITETTLSNNVESLPSLVSNFERKWTKKSKIFSNLFLL